MHKILPWLGLLKTSEHWDLCFWLAHQLHSNPATFFPTLITFPFVNRNCFSSLHLLWHLFFFFEDPSLLIHLSPDLFLFFWRGGGFFHGHLNYAFWLHVKPSNILHMWFNELYLRLEMCRWFLSLPALAWRAVHMLIGKLLKIIDVLQWEQRISYRDKQSMKWISNFTFSCRFKT